MNNKYDQDYYQNGVAAGKSCYENYRWIPELTYPLAFSILKYLGIENCNSILDYGCAHGFIAKALKDFGVNAYGVDISDYAVANSPQELKGRTFKISEDNTLDHIVKNIIKINKFDYVISKDVFEHIEPDLLAEILSELSLITNNLFVVVPLGDNGKYRIEAYHRDITHVIAEDELWWNKILTDNGWIIKDFQHSVPGIKQNWTEINKTGNGFYNLRSKIL